MVSIRMTPHQRMLVLYQDMHAQRSNFRCSPDPANKRSPVLIGSAVSATHMVVSEMLHSKCSLGNVYTVHRNEYMAILPSDIIALYPTTFDKST